jgi:phosphoribosylanthranilate isomerase
MMAYTPKIKVCGLTNLADARAAASLGADYLGFVFAPSPRRLSIRAAEEFWHDLPPGVPRVGVFKDQKAAEVAAIIERLPLGYLQFHGSESPAICRSFALPVIKALSVTDVRDLHLLELYNEVADFFLLDLPKERAATPVLPRKIGRSAAALARPAFLAGGLDPANVGDFVADLRPFGIDVARGVEKEPGVKDFDKMQKFMARARGSAPSLRRGEGKPEK